MKGLGVNNRKGGFVLDLPKEDAREFWKHLSEAYKQRLTQI